MGVLNALMYGVAICLGTYVVDFMVMFLVCIGISIFIIYKYKVWKGFKK